MRNQQLEHELERIINSDTVNIESWSNEDGYYLQINGNGYLYHILNDLMLDCIELSRRFNLVFV